MTNCTSLYRVWHIIAIFVLTVVLADHSADATAISRAILVEIDTTAVPQATVLPIIQMEVRAVAPTGSSNTATGVAVAAASSTATRLPQPFDSSIGSNFTSSTCPDFITTFLKDTSFVNCYPFSLLLQVSHC
jgi:hypothetical protein